MVEGHQTELASPTEQTRNEKLSDEQLGNLISAVGNNLAKAITLLAMRDGNIYSARDLQKAILYPQSQEGGWKVSPGLLFGYCANSLAPIGLVAKEALNPDLSAFGYQITDDGKAVGIPFCGLMIDWSMKHNISLPHLWGSTQSPAKNTPISETIGEELELKKRAPITTLKILYEIITEPHLPIRVTDLASRLNENEGAIPNHLLRLDKAGLIKYLSIEANIPFSAYKLVPNAPTDSPPAYLEYRSLPESILSVFKQHPDLFLTRQEIYNFLPEEIRKRSTGKSLISNIAGVLAHFKRHGYLKSEKFSFAAQSEINLEESQIIILTELLEIIDRFQNQDPEIISEGNRLAAEIIANPSRVSNVLRKAKEQSSYTSNMSFSEKRDLVAYFLSSHPGITNKELQQLFKEEGKNFGPAAVKELTARLEVEHFLKSTFEHGAKRFFPKDRPD